MSGPPGSGKSTLARLLRPSLNGVIIDHDIVRSSLLGPSTAIPFDQAASQADDLQWELTKDLASQDVDAIIVDSTCNYPELLKQGSELAAQHGYIYWYFECRVDSFDLLDRRLRERRPMASERSAADVPPVAAQGAGGRMGQDSRALFVNWIENPCRPEDEHCILLDSTADPETLRDQVLRQIVN